MCDVLSHVHLFATPCTVACQAPLSMGFSKQEYWSGLPFSSPGGLPDPGIEPESPVSPALHVDSLPADPSGMSTNSAQGSNFFILMQTLAIFWAFKKM